MKNLNRWIKIVTMASVLFLVACDEVEFENGKIPSEYISRAKALTGTYAGHFYKQDGQLELKLQGDLAVLSFKSEQGDDLLASGNCKSKIGKLKKAHISKNKDISHLIFSFNPGTCDIPGRELDLEFSQNYKKITLTLADHDYLDQECEWTDRGHNPTVPPTYECHEVVRKHSFSGTFVRRP